MVKAMTELYFSWVQPNGNTNALPEKMGLMGRPGSPWGSDTKKNPGLVAREFPGLFFSYYHSAGNY